ncbi:MAG: adenosylcobinamide-GDP ribazoletransferase, partial [Actinobacteria bacterium]|nr:adenosylcobinamide-GDP ribazoletransferase [Actinomycetota bacterium]
ADGLLPHLPPDRRLAVMADPHVGAFGVAAGATALLLRTAALAAMGAARPLLLAGLWALSRTAMAVTAMTGRYARSQGLASSFLPDTPSGTPSPGTPPPGTSSPPGAPSSRLPMAGLPSWAVPGLTGAVLALLLAALEGIELIVAVLAAAAAAAGVAAFARRRIGGFTGDTLGAGGFIAETVGLLVAVAVLSP